MDTIGRIGAYQYREQVGDKEVRKRSYFQENARTFRCSISRWPKVKAVDEILLSLQEFEGFGWSSLLDDSKNMIFFGTKQNILYLLQLGLFEAAE